MIRPAFVPVLVAAPLPVVGAVLGGQGRWLLLAVILAAVVAFTLLWNRRLDRLQRERFARERLEQQVRHALERRQW